MIKRSILKVYDQKSMFLSNKIKSSNYSLDKKYSMKMVVAYRKTYVYKKTPIIGDKYAIAFLRAHL